MKNWLFLCVIIIGVNAKGQLWSVYSDSAKANLDKKNEDSAIFYYSKSLFEIKKDSPQSLTYSLICNNLANLHKGKEQYDKAEPLLFEVRKTKGTLLGKGHLEYGKSCFNLAILYYILNDKYGNAASIFLEAKNIFGAELGREHPNYIKTCNILASLYHSKGEYKNAEQTYIEAIDIIGKSIGKNSFEYAEDCNYLGNVYANMGRFEKAELLYLETREIVKTLFGKEDYKYGVICTNLSALYEDMGLYEKVEPLSLEADIIFEKLLGKDHPDYASNRGNLANYYRKVGNYSKAESIELEVLKIREKSSGKMNANYAASCENLASLYKDMLEYKKAEKFYLEARMIKENILGKQHPDYALNCNNIGTFYLDNKQYELAEAALLEALELRKKLIGKEHPQYISSCNNLGQLYFEMGLYKKAEPFYSEALKLADDLSGKEYPDYLTISNNLGNLYWSLKEFEKARHFYSELFNAQRIQNKKMYQFTSELEKQFYARQAENFGNYILSFHANEKNYASPGLSYDLSLFNRNGILSSSIQMRSSILNSTDTTIRNGYENWVELKKQLAFWYTKPIAGREEYVKPLEEKANTLEKNLTRFSSEFKKQQEQQELSWKNIKQNLKIGEAAIEFIEFEYYNGKRWTDSTYYIALILRKDKLEPELIKLFEKRQLDSMLTYKSTSAGQVQLSYLYGKRQEGKTKSLYDIIWKPIEQKLTGINTVYFALAGSLHKIAFAALPVNNKEVLSDKYQLLQLNTTASVGDNSMKHLSASDKIILYGGVKYDADSTSIRQAALKYSGNDVATHSLPDDLLRDGVGEFYYLPASENEVAVISKLATVNKYVSTISEGMMATEESFKALTGKNSPAVLHIATHGFFFPDPKSNKKDDKMGGAIVFRQSDNPLIRSGLALAGANNAWNGKPVKGVEDGILTSYEVSNMHLPNTKLAVLSACETGLGDIQGSEGVYGLQRAFKMAGVENLIMSLWKVDDAATSEFMQEFYKNLFEKQTINNAFYNAQTIMKNKYRNDPYKWAAWVLIR